MTTDTPTAPETPTPAPAGAEATAPAPSGDRTDHADPSGPSGSPGSSGPSDGRAPSGDTWPAAPPAPDAWGPPTGAPAARPSEPTRTEPTPSGDAWAPAGRDSSPGDDQAGEGEEDDAGGATTVVLGGVGTAAKPPPPAPRLSPDAVAATTSTRTTDPHGMRALRPRITPPTGTTRVEAEAEGEPAPRHLRSDEEPGERRRTVLLLAAPILIVVLFLLGWAIDSAALSGQVMRNVEVAGRPVGGLGEASLPEVMNQIAEDAAARPVHIVNGERTYETTAGAIGLTVDEEATADAALDAGRNDSIFVRPFKWLGSFFGSRDVPVEYGVSEGAAALTLVQLQGGDATAPTEPTVVLNGDTGEFVVMPGQVGTGINSQEVAEALPAAAEEDTSGPIVIEADTAEVQPQYTDEAAQELANEANEMTANGLTLRVEDTTVEVPAAQLRTWIGQAPPDQGFELAANGDVIRRDLPGLFTELAAPQNATVTLAANGQPQVRPGRNGITCCNDDSTQRIWNALSGGEAEVELEANVAEPEITTEEAEAWRVAEPVGGARAWRDGAEVPGPAPGFTTYHAPGESRVTNIHRIADLVRGAVIPPDGTFSINEHVGQRTAANGFVEAGAIRNGRHVPEIGGGVSQFATTTFNAAYFAGLDIVEYQAHTEWFSRYPRGREATMGYPAPDLKIHNNTPYGILIWTSYTDTSITVTLYSTPYITAEQTGSSESAAGPGCTTVETTRTRTWPEGRTDTDTFRATYRNREGFNCENQPIPPDPAEAAAR